MALVTSVLHSRQGVGGRVPLAKQVFVEIKGAKHIAKAWGMHPEENLILDSEITSAAFSDA